MTRRTRALEDGWESLEEGEGELRVSEAVMPWDKRSGCDRLIDEAHRQLGAVRETTYSHETWIDEEAGIFEYDCSGFVDYALAKADPGALSELRGEREKKDRRNRRTTRPLAETYVHLLHEVEPGGRTKAWERIGTIHAIGAGSVVAWLKPPTSTSKNTGHVMVVEHAPTQRAKHEWIVPIIDSSHGHGGADRRTRKSSGIGRGEIVLVVGESGAPRGFRWKTLASSPFAETETVFGRLL